MANQLDGATVLQCRDALRLIAQALPDRNKDREAVLSNALACITVDGQNRVRAQDIVKRFIGECPYCWGADRTSRYWNTLLSFFDRDEALALYLSCFPTEITLDQYNALKRGLVSRRGYAEAVVDQALKQRFMIRENHGCRSPGASSPLW